MGPRFAPAGFNALLRPSGVGQAVLWRRASLCPCRDPYSDQAEPGCPRCAGRGMFWAQGRGAHAGVTSQRLARAWLDAGQIEMGDQILSVPGDSPLYGAGENDLVVMTQSSEPYAVVRTRDGGETIDPTAYALDQCIALRPGDRAVVELALPSVHPQTGALTWADQSRAPEPGMQFSLRGRRRPVYFVFRELPQDRAHSNGQPLPRRIHTRRFDLMGR